MALFKSKPDDEGATPRPASTRRTSPPRATPPMTVPTPRGPQRKAQATPSRREAEAARRERLNPTLSPKESKRRERAARVEARQKAYAATEGAPERQLVRDVVDSRFNLGEVAMPLMFALLLTTLIPGLSTSQFGTYTIVAMYGFLLWLMLDLVMAWNRIKRLVAERQPGTPLRGLMMLTFNRQLSFRRWRQPPPRVKRGEAI